MPGSVVIEQAPWTLWVPLALLWALALRLGLRKVLHG